MSNAIPSTQPHSPALNAGIPGAIVLAAWLLAVLILGSHGAFAGAPGSPPIALLVAFVAPIGTFLIALRASTAFRTFVLNFDPRLLVAMQAWRFGGFAFISLYVHGILPGYFAWPAGLGDMAIGFAAPWMLSGLMESRTFASSRRFIAWNLLGLLDLAVAMSLGAIGSFLIAGGPGTVTTAPMAELPLVLIPVYLVPLFIMMHVTALAQASTRTA
ncbi:MAG TPA: hypothetical protein VGO25_00670 [Rhodanobacteraceae bacterium]|jgi:hypothetical protein|nr:hypothetical protein [Rhodanobacteraceae bacterium]